MVCAAVLCRQTSCRLAAVCCQEVARPVLDVAYARGNSATPLERCCVACFCMLSAFCNMSAEGSHTYLGPRGGTCGVLSWSFVTAGWTCARTCNASAGWTAMALGGFHGSDHCSLAQISISACKEGQKCSYIVRMAVSCDLWQACCHRRTSAFMLGPPAQGCLHRWWTPQQDTKRAQDPVLHL